MPSQVNLLANALVGLAVIVIVEVGIWMYACLGLSMKHREADFTEMMLRAPYRVFWLPKLVITVWVIAVFAIAANYYQAGGQSLTLAALTFGGLICFGFVAVIESVRAVRSYEKGERR